MHSLNPAYSKVWMFPRVRNLRGFLLGGLALFFWPVWQWYSLRMTDGSDEPLGMLALVGVVALLRERRAEKAEWFPLGLAVGLAGYVWFLAVGGAPLPRAMCALVALASVGIGRRRGAAGMFGLLLLSLPVLASVQFYLGYPMRIFAAWITEAGLGILGIETAREGMTLYREGVPVLVDAPCSGVRMLWCALALHCFLAARRGSGASAVMLGSVGVSLMVLLGNALRSMVLFLKESGMVGMAEWMHEGVGLLVFALVCVAVVRVHGVALRIRRPKGRWLGAVCVLAALPLVLLLPERRVVGDEGFPGWPLRFEGRVLTEVPLEGADARFADGFPGKIARFTDGGRWLILRWVAQPTRKLHSAADCLRGMGYTVGERTIRSAVDETRWASFRAWDREGEALEVRERISDGTGRGWTDVSEWYWNASLGKTEGAWWAVTILE